MSDFDDLSNISRILRTIRHNDFLSIDDYPGGKRRVVIDGSTDITDAEFAALKHVLGQDDEFDDL